MRKISKPCGFHCVKIKDIGVSFGEQTILENINLHIHCGQLLAIIGRNGAGKSTLIKAILDDIPHTGTVEFKDVEDGKIQKIKIGYVPQTLNVEENAPMDVYDLICSFRYSHPIFMKSRKIYGEIKEALEEFEAGDLIDKQVGRLSGGELQRVLLSMAVMDNPNLLLLDEPVSGIDKNGMDLFYEKMEYLKNNYDMSIVVVSHDLDYVAKYADQVVLIDKEVMAEGTVKEVYNSQEFKNVFGNTQFDISSASNATHMYDVDSAKRHVHKRVPPEEQVPFEAGYKGRKEQK